MPITAKPDGSVNAVRVHEGASHLFMSQIGLFCFAEGESLQSGASSNFCIHKPLNNFQPPNNVHLHTASSRLQHESNADRESLLQVGQKRLGVNAIVHSLLIIAPHDSVPLQAGFESEFAFSSVIDDCMPIVKLKACDWCLNMGGLKRTQIMRVDIGCSSRTAL